MQTKRLAVVLLVCFSVPLSFATEKKAVLEEILVTAEKREASLQDTPISISAFSTADIEKNGVINLANIQYSVPNMTMRQFPNSQSSLRIFIRGIGNNDIQVTQDPAIGVYMDGIYIARSSGLASELVDPERIEVLRGPQGTLYGRNATGGAINIISRAPSGEFGLSQSVTAGNYDRFVAKTDVDLPAIGDSLYVKLGYIYSERNGWVENKSKGPDFGDEKKQGARLALRFSPTDRLTVDYAYDVTNNESGALYYQTIDAPNAGYEEVDYSPHFMDSVSPSHGTEKSELDIDGHSLIITYDLSEHAILKSLTGYRDMDESNYQDYSANSGTDRLFANDPFETTHDQFSQEFQLNGALLDQQLDYILGVYYFEETGLESSTDYIGVAVETVSGPLPSPIPLSAALPPYEDVLQTRRTEAKNEALAVFGQATWSPGFLSDKWHFTVGLRQTKDKRAVKGSRSNGVWGLAFGGEDFSNVKADEDFSNLSPAFTVAWDVSDDANLYVKYVEGYRTGGFSSRGVSVASLTTPIAEESVSNIELGLKSQWLDDRLRLNMALFDSDYEDIQLSFATQNNAADVILFNAGKAKITGFEADLIAVISPDLQFSASYAWLDPSLDEVINPNTGSNDADLYSLPGTPEESYVLDITYMPELSGGSSLIANVNYSWLGSQWPASDSAAISHAEIDSYGLLNARLGLKDISLGAMQLDLALWGKNLTDEEYLLDAIGAFQWSTRVGAYGEPRSYGLDLRLRL